MYIIVTLYSNKLLSVDDKKKMDVKYYFLKVPRKYRRLYEIDIDRQFNLIIID
ncbi:protein of unknown function [Candidatus Nitrosocosmicus franklandus]|uniref:Uncharacterized protein n=1 Tax=Candidatus Nitrosocosmicus franklandianus TaxID=1798806 RepID=A0A484IE39_9ARCH|nr:protein of unknown function [Candidatus Nitrosocosmicus franklandus]